MEQLKKLSQIQIAAIILFAVGSGFYLNTLKNGYALDDQLAIYENQFVKKGFGGLGDIFTTDAFEGFFGKRGSSLISGGRYRPLSYAAFAVEWQFFGNNPMVGHLVNILLYGLLSALIFVFLNALFGDKNTAENNSPTQSQNTFGRNFFLSISFLSALIYAIHPIHTEVVANIKGRDEILAFLFGVLAMIWFAKPELKKWKDYGILFLFYFLALLSKENAITFLAIFALIFFYQKGKDYQRWIPIGLASVLYLVLRFSFTASKVSESKTEILNNPFVRATGTEKIATILYSFFKYLQLLIFPKTLSHDYYFNQIPYQKFSNPAVLFAVAMILFLIYYVAKNFKNRTPIVFGILFFVITFSVVSNIPFTVGIIMNERFVFIPSLGFAIIVGYFLSKWAENVRFRPLVLGFLGVIFVLSFVKVYTRNGDWKDNFSLFKADFQNSPNSAKVSTSLGGTYMEEARKAQDTATKRRYMDSSFLLLAHSIEIYPEYAQTWLLLGNAYEYRDKNYPKAIEMYRHAMDLGTGNQFDPYFNAALLYYNMGNMDSAQIYMENALKISPDHPQANQVYRQILARNGKADKALSMASGGNARVEDYVQICEAAKVSNNFTQMQDVADKILTLDPQSGAGNYFKGLALARGFQKIPESIPYFEKAIAKDPDNPSWNEDLAVAYGITGQFQKTIPLLLKVIAARPNDPNPYYNLSASYYQLGQKQKAAEYRQKGDALKR